MKEPNDDLAGRAAPGIRPPGEPAAKPARSGELRCHCGSLIARVVGGNLEVKCRRCQRVGLIDLAAAAGGAAVEIRWSEDVVRTRAAVRP